MPDPYEQELLALVKLWVQQKPFLSVVSAAEFSTKNIPDEILEPFIFKSKQLMENTALWPAFPRAGGSGLRYRLSEYQVHRITPGQAETSSFVYHVRWATSMANHAPGYEDQGYKISRLVRENDAWETAAILRESEREETTRYLRCFHGDTCP